MPNTQSETTAGPATDATHLADDVVLLADAAELGDPDAVIRAAQAAGVQAVHPGYGPLRAEPQLARLAAAAGLRAAVTTGVVAPGEIATALAGENVPMSSAAIDRWVYVIGRAGRLDVLGSAWVASDGALIGGEPEPSSDSAAGPADPADPAGPGRPLDGPNGDHRLAHAAAVVLGLDGVAAVGLASDGVVEVAPGLAPSHAAWELVTGFDLVEIQLGLDTDDVDLTTGGVAVGSGTRRRRRRCARAGPTRGRGRRCGRKRYVSTRSLSPVTGTGRSSGPPPGPRTRPVRASSCPGSTENCASATPADGGAALSRCAERAWTRRLRQRRQRPAPTRRLPGHPSRSESPPAT